MRRTWNALLTCAAFVAALPLAAAEPKAVTALRHLKPIVNAGPFNWSSGDYKYDGAGNVVAIGTDAYAYDADQRLTSASLRGPDRASVAQQTYTYDAYGNLTKVGNQALTVDAATNRLTSFSAHYDAAGRIDKWALTPSGTPHLFVHDGADMLQTVRVSTDTLPAVAYVYNADDERVLTRTVRTKSVHWTLRGPGHAVLREFEQTPAQWTWGRDYVYRGPLLLASVAPAGEEHYSLDHLGTPKVVTNTAAQRIGYHVYWPFGEEWTGPSTTAGTHRFTGHERDAAIDGETVDYMHARYYQARVGRFLSVDPSLHIDRASENPQMWNRYSYVANNPIKAVDPDGRDVYVVVTNQDVGDTIIRSKPGGASVSGQKTETVAAYRVVMMNESGTVNLDFEVSRDTNFADVSGQTRGDYTASKETPPGQYVGTIVNSSKLGPSLLLSDKKGGNTIKTPDGYTKSGAMIHIGPGCSEGCFLLTGGKSNRNMFMTALKTLLNQDAKANKGTDIHVVVQPRNSRECSSDTCVLK